MAHTLDEFHADLEAMMADGDTLLASRDPANAKRVKQRVAEAVMLVASYQIFVHREVFAPMLANGDADLRARVTELKVECIALTEDIRFNVRDFMTGDEPLDWDRLSAKVGWFNGRVRAHVAQVRKVLARRDEVAPALAPITRRTGWVGVQPVG